MSGRVRAGAFGPAQLGNGRNDRLLAVAAWTVPVLVGGVFGWLLFDLLRHGLGGLSWTFLTTAPEAAGRAGGIGPVLFSTLLILAVCLLAAVPVGMLTAVLLSGVVGRPPSQMRSTFLRSVRRSLDVLAGVPSIVFGLFGNAFFSIVLGMGFSILSGGLTLACMVLPIFIREAEEALRQVPAELRLSAAALGLSRTKTLTSILLPAALPGITVGLVLGIGRALAETAALIFTSGYVDRMPGSLLDSGRSLSIHIYDLSMNVAGGEPNAYATALVLVGLLLVINSAAASLSARWHRRG
ncbi:MAG: phosphate ABC transporter permease PstA [Thermoanaerobaculia bacterium]|nr:phosphate ABC transporter permease PstA [Thermoanaerobaculia bacterium]